MYTRGLGVVPSDCLSFWKWSTTPGCWANSIPAWQEQLTVAGAAPPPAPSGSVLTVPPQSGVDAQATVDALAAEQMRRQQAADAAQVQPVSDLYSLFNSMTGGIFAGNPNPNQAPSGFSVPWWAWAIGGGIFLVAAFGGRR